MHFYGFNKLDNGFCIKHSWLDSYEIHFYFIFIPDYDSLWSHKDKDMAENTNEISYSVETK